MLEREQMNADFLQDLPFYDSPRIVSSPYWPTVIQLKPFQILLWLSITEQGVDQISSDLPRVPVLLDTGQNHTLCLRDSHLMHSGLKAPFPWSSSPLRVRVASGTERMVPRLLVDVWLHSNIPVLMEHPLLIRLGLRGAACFLLSGAIQGPHLPLLGLAALCAGSVTVEMQCKPEGGILNLRVSEAPSK